jgi:hypothetical protein
MQYSIIALAGAASVAVALPQYSPGTEAPVGSQPFYTTVVGAGLGGITLNSLTAADGVISIGGAQDEVCEDPTVNQDAASFALYSDGQLYLNSNNQTAQQVYVEATGRTGGRALYTSDQSKLVGGLPEDKFVVDPQYGNLTWNGYGTKACPTTQQGVFTLWFTSDQYPGNQASCFDINVNAYKSNNIIIPKCTYSEPCE